MELAPEQDRNKYRVRPRFEITCPLSTDQIVEAAQNYAQREDSTCLVQGYHGFVKILLPLSEQHYWSPQLNINLIEDENGTLMRGLYGPRPAVWTMFVFFYGLIGVAILFVAIFGFSQLSLDRPAPILWLLPVLIVVFLTLYLVSYFGQKLGHDQMIILHNFVEASLDVSFEEENIEGI